MELVMILLVLTLILIINTLSFRSYLFLLRYLGVNVHPHEYYAKLLLVNLDNHAQAPPQKPSAFSYSCTCQVLPKRAFPSHPLMKGRPIPGSVAIYI